jgi:hypothetical protein
MSQPRRKNAATAPLSRQKFQMRALIRGKKFSSYASWAIMKNFAQEGIETFFDQNSAASEEKEKAQSTPASVFVANRGSTAPL